MRRIAAPLAFALLAVACTRSAAPPPRKAASAPPPATIVPPPPAAPDWRDVPLTPGAWFYAAAPGGSSARYGLSSAAALFEIACDRTARTVSLSLLGHGGGGLTLRTSYSTYSVLFRSSMKDKVVAALPANNRFLDEIAFSRGRFTVSDPGSPPLVLPAWAEPARVIEDCRG